MGRVVAMMLWEKTEDSCQNWILFNLQKCCQGFADKGPERAGHNLLGAWGIST